MAKQLLVGAVLALFAISASPHPGGKDVAGCHADKNGVEMHCHGPNEEILPWPPVKKSRNAICHDRDSPWYNQTIHFQPFNSLKECLDSGGRLPMTQDAAASPDPSE